MTLNGALRQPFRQGIVGNQDDIFQRITADFCKQHFLCVHLLQWVRSVYILERYLLYILSYLGPINWRHCEILNYSGGSIFSFWICFLRKLLNTLRYSFDATCLCADVLLKPIFVQLWTSTFVSEAHLFKCVQPCWLSRASFWSALCIISLDFEGGTVIVFFDNTIDIKN